MTRTKALEASRALDAIDGFQMFMEEVDRAVNDCDTFIMNPEFVSALNELMETELARLNQELEDL